MDLIDLTPGLKAVLDNLNAANGRPVIVGGAVRDALLGRQSSDIDIECYGIDYSDIIKALHTLGECDLFGVSFSTVKVAVNDESYDVSLPRREIKTGAGHQGFSVEADPSMSFMQAAARRDFTINAMGWDPFAQELLDPHSGEQDLRQHWLRHVGPAFVEDPLRVLRGARFAATFNMQMRSNTVALCRSLREEYQALSVDRVWREFYRIATESFVPSRALWVLEDTDWIELFPELHAVYDVRQDPEWHPEGNVQDHIHQCMDAAAAVCEDRDITGDDRAVVVLGALVHDLGKATCTTVDPDGRIRSKGHAEAGVEPAKAFLNQIGAPHHIIDRILPVVREHMRVVNGPPSASAARRLVRDLGSASIHDWALVVEADHLGRGAAAEAGLSEPWLDKVVDYEITPETNKPILKGEVLMALGLKPGPDFRKIIAASLEAQDDGLISDSESAVAWATEHVKEFYS